MSFLAFTPHFALRARPQPIARLCAPRHYVRLSIPCAHGAEPAEPAEGGEERRASCSGSSKVNCPAHITRNMPSTRSTCAGVPASADEPLVRFQSRPRSPGRPSAQPRCSLGESFSVASRRARVPSPSLWLAPAGGMAARGCACLGGRSRPAMASQRRSPLRRSVSAYSRCALQARACTGARDGRRQRPSASGRT